MLSPNWVKRTDQAWLRLEKVDLSEVTTQGVYLIWHGAYTWRDQNGRECLQQSRWVRVGQGVICDRLQVHRSDAAILKYRAGTLYVTWASIPVAQRDGVERYLGEQLNPLVAERFPQAVPIPVRLPAAA